jgi:ribulose-5-phosphate 4-epimerase/fuculose-1-phosphate aldolase
MRRDNAAVIATALAMNTLGINRGKSGNVSVRCSEVRSTAS